MTPQEVPPELLDMAPSIPPVLMAQILTRYGEIIQEMFRSGMVRVEEPDDFSHNTL